MVLVMSKAGSVTSCREINKDQEMCFDLSLCKAKQNHG